MIPAATICNTCGNPLDPARHHGRCAGCLFAEAFAPAEAGGALGTIGGHDLIREIARGGMGVVYRARQPEPERVVALKTMRGTELDSPAALLRFRQEARAMAGLEHAAILPVFAFGEQDGIPFFTMKLATGGTLAQRLGGYEGKWRAVAELIARVADAVQHAHTHAVLHRDLKPANILFDEKDQAFVSDFGLAKLLDSTDATLTRTTAMMGTPHYLAPEIAAHDARAATTASDVWSLGVILYELLVQRRPFEGDSIAAVLRAITDTEPAALPRVPRDLCVITGKALAKEPARRYASADALAEDLRRWLGGRPILARPVSPLERTALWTQRNPTLATLAAAAALLLLAGVTGIAIQWRRAESAERTMRERLAHEHIRAGQRLAETGDPLCGLPHTVEALRLGLGDAARERVARLRFETTLRQSPRLAQLWLPESAGDVQWAEESGRVVINAGSETRVWDAETGVAVSPPWADSGEVRRVWTDARASRIVTSTRDDRLIVRDGGDGSVLATHSGEGHLRAVFGGPRLRLAVLQRAAGNVLCVSALDGAVDATLSHEEKIQWAVMSPDGARVLAATKQALLLWDVASRALVLPPVDFGGEPDFGNFDPSGDLAGLRVKHENGIAVFDLRTGLLAARGVAESIGSLRHGWIEGGRWVVLARKASGSALRDGATGQLLFDATTGAGTTVADFAAGAPAFALSGENGATQVWDAITARALTPRLWSGGRADRLVMNADATKLLLSTSEPAVRIWESSAHGNAAWSATEAAPALAVWWKGGRLFAVDTDARLTVRDFAKGTSAREAVALDDAATGAAPDAAGRVVFVGGAHGARLWDAENGQPAGPLIPPDGTVREVALSADGRRAAVLLEKVVLLCDPATGAVQHTLAHDGAQHILLSPDGTRLVTISNAEVQLWDALTGAPVGGPLAEGGAWRDPGVRFDPQGGRFVVWWSGPQTLPGRLRVLDAASGQEMRPPLEHPTAVIHATFSADGTLLATGTRDQRLWLWRMSDGRPALAPIPHEDRINGVGFSPDGLLIWSRSGRVLRTWETLTGDAVAPPLNHQGPPPPERRRGAKGSVITDDDEEVKIAWSADGQVASADSRGGVNAWDFRSGTRSLAEMEALAQVLSMHRIEPGGGLVLLTREELRAAWAAAHPK